MESPDPRARADQLSVQSLDFHQFTPMWRGHLAGQASIRQATRALSGTANHRYQKDIDRLPRLFLFAIATPISPLPCPSRPGIVVCKQDSQQQPGTCTDSG